MKRFLVALIVILTTAAASTLGGQDAGFAGRPGASARESGSIDTARELYASARYDEALALLNGLRTTEAADPSQRKTIEQYRSLCLLALGRDQEAVTAIAAVVTTDPFFVPSDAEASPRVRTAFSDVRAKLLPDIAAARYVSAKRLFDRKEHAAAEREFRELVALLDDPQMNGRHGDLKTLAKGFHDLAAAAAAPPPEPAKPTPAPVPAAPAAATPPPAPRIYGGEDPQVTPPVALRQQFPSVPASITGLTKDRGILEVIVDEQGRVVSFTLRSTIHPVYDSLLSSAVREWKYKPATLKGVPVRFRKLIQITLPRR